SDRQKTDWPCADDRNRFARADRCQANGMQGNCERLCQSRFVARYPCGYGKEIGDRQVDKLSEEAWVVRVAQKANVRAHVVVPAQTELAVIAIKRRLKCPAVARRGALEPALYCYH